MANEKLIRKFTTALERAFSRNTEKIDDQIDFDDKYSHLFKQEYETAIKIIVSVKDADTLQGLMTSYLELFFRYDTNKNNTHFYRSDQTYEVLYERSAAVQADKRDLFEEWAEYLTASPVADSYNSYKKRFRELSPTSQSNINAFIHQEKEKRRKSKSIMDLLRDAYLRQNGRRARNHDDLYEFDPHPRPTLEQSLEEQLDHIRKLWAECVGKRERADTQNLFRSLDDYRKYLVNVSRDGHLPLFQVLKYLQERIQTTRENMGRWTRRNDGDHSELMCELYAMACLQLFVLGKVTHLLGKNQKGFTREEQDYLLHHLREIPYHYVSNLEARFASPLDDVAAFFEQTKAFLYLILVTKTELTTATLVDRKQTLKIQNLWTEIDNLTRRLKGGNEDGQRKVLSESQNLATLSKLLEIAETRVPIGRQGPELGKGEARAGSSPGVHEVFGRVTIIYIEPRHRDDFYVEFAGLKPALFLVHTGFITDALYLGRIRDIYRRTVGSVYLTQAIFLMMGFAPVLIQSGFAALVVEVGIFFTSTKIEELASKANPTFGKVLGLIAQLLAPRPNFKPKVTGVVADKSIRVLTVETTVSRSFDEILASQKAAAKLIADANKGTLKGAVAKARDAMRDRIMELEFGKAAAALDVLPVEAVAATEQSAMLRVAQKGAQGARTGGAGSGSRAESALRKSPEFRLLEEYHPLLEKDQLLLTRKEVNAIIRDLRNGTLGYSEARQEIINLLNSAKELTGEYAADFAVLSNFDVLEVFAIPRREGGVPMLDRVYKVRDSQTNQIEYLWVEAKGGERARLGFVTRKTYAFRKGRLSITVAPNDWVRQASGEWYYQKIIEIYESGNETLARKLFDAARAGKVQSAIIKSGKAMDPNIKFNTGEVIEWFKGRKLPYD